MNNLYIVSTPIGNLQDLTVRAMNVLLNGPVIFSENPTKTRNLISYIRQNYPEIAKNHSPSIISCNEYEEEMKIPKILSFLKNHDVVYVSSAGTPLISDPGFKLVREARKQGIRVIPVPGPSAFVAAVSVSGLPTDKMLFLGFAPKSKGKKADFFKRVHKYCEVGFELNVVPTIVLYESPHRISETLQIMKDEFGDIPLVIARELTKIYEEIVTKKIGEHIESLSKKPLGEYCILFNLKS